MQTIPEQLPISVVIPAFNGAAFLAAALQSVRSQTCSPSEIIVVDDGSTDATAEVARRCGVRVLCESHRGVSATRNAGILAATQPWIAFLDADDVWLPQKLASQWTAAQRNPQVGLIFTDYSIVTHGRTTVQSFMVWRDVRLVMMGQVGQAGATCEHSSFCSEYFEKNFIMASSPLVRKDLLLQVGLFDEGLRYCEDYELMLRLLAVTAVAYVPEPLVEYRFHESNATSPGGAKLPLGKAAVAQRVFANPARYPSAALPYFHRQLPTDLRTAGVDLLREGRPLQARAHLRSSLHERFQPLTLGAYLATFVLQMGGTRFHRSLRALWRLRPRVRKPSQKG